MKYFAYGSNMSVPRLRNRIPMLEKIGVYALQGHELRFHKAGTDGSAKCDAFETGNSEDVVIGVLFEIDSQGKEILDRIEGLGMGYAEKSVNLIHASGSVSKAQTYFATHIDNARKPYKWYVEHVLKGAREAPLPADYVARIVSVVSINDPDLDREVRQRAIYDRTTTP
ncbi:MAG: gamma-glutamylcyclotransferase family protein [Gammaproteobacteria bacterium]|jgi:hypothetical protein|nr:gamma-glutamylcyclotransferase family protein [Gammaproteobacteria bacterium]MDP6536551.1 gamma-glutamylcyclotransferase family protein [Gammaproteobacteria bacterium]MDP6733069.1 gamma-glutamylcyclotransferase family protein [Gammaproteobacteria bacterium]HAJ76685.1 gamma-glutamylcyclotransferase [Gammaproteobacteria bacterium]